MNTVPAALARAAERFGDREAVVDGPVRLRYAELAARARGFAGFLAAQGIRHGDRVALCAPNTANWVVAALGTLCAGAVLVPVNTRYTAAETADLLRRAAVRGLVVATDFLGRDRLAELRTHDPDALPGLVVPADGPLPQADHPLPDVHPDDVADVLFTSGTTGRSKGAMSAHRQSLAVAAAWAACGEVTAADRYLVVNPFFHSFGYKAGILVCLLTGAALLPVPVYDRDTLPRLVAAERVTVLPAAPTVYQDLLGRPDLGSLRLAVTGAATVPITLVERMQSELAVDTVLTAYGLTEAVVATMCRPGDDARTVATTCGRAAAGFEVAVDAAGEVLLRGENVMLGYLDDPAATAAAVDAEGWLHTGDVGTLDARGYLTITDRLKDMYVSGGFNVYPAEVEQVLARLPGVADVAVVGVPDGRLGEVGAAFVVRADPELAAADVLAHCRGVLAGFKVPRRVMFVDTLPRNASGKLLKRELRKEIP